MSHRRFIGILLLSTLVSASSAFAAGPYISPADRAGTGITATASAPVLPEGSAGYNSYDLIGNQRTTLGTLIAGEDQGSGGDTSLIRTSGGRVRQTTVISGVTTNTTSAATTIFTGSKSLYGQVVCSSGACTQTQAVFGDIDNDAANGILLCTITLSGTPRAQDACPPFTAEYSFYYVTTTSTTGTAATGALYAMY